MTKTNGILIVDDTQSVRRAMKVAFVRGPFKIFEACGGEEAVEILKERKEEIDLILLDMMMPGMDGLETFELIKTIAPNLPAIMVTAHGSLNLGVEFMKMGGADFMEKPFNYSVLRLKVDQALEKNKLRSQLEQSKVRQKAIEATNKLKMNFVANISHELLTPLHAVLNFSSLGGQQVEEGDPKLHRYFNRIAESGDKLMTKINSLLHLTHLDTQTTEIHPSPTRPYQLIKSLITSLEGNPKNEAFNFVMEPTMEDITLPLDGEKIQEALGQILANSMKYAGQGTIRISMEPHDESGGEPGWVEINIKDEGPGIPEDELETVFDQFSQSTRTQNGAGGTGMGLSICRKIIDGHGGRIWAENNDTGGTNIRILLPPTARVNMPSEKPVEEKR